MSSTEVHQQTERVNHDEFDVELLGETSAELHAALRLLRPVDADDDRPDDG